MAGFVQKPCTGSLWPNDHRHPDHSGTIVLPDGTECFLDAWLRTTKTGKKYLSLSIKPKNLQRQPPAERPQQSRPTLPQRPQSRPAPPPLRPAEQPAAAPRANEGIDPVDGEDDIPF